MSLDLLDRCEAGQAASSHPGAAGITPQPIGLGACPTLQTARLVLRPHQAGDAEAIAASLSDYAVARMLARVPLPFHVADARDWLATLPRQRGWALAVTREATHVGCVHLELRHGRYHLGYWLNRAVWGQGIGGEAVAAALAAFRIALPEAVVHSGVFADNPASLALQARLGFAVTGCADVYSRARGRMVTHLETRLDPAACA
ncbi:GNAT family N-acetyltransferase [Rhizobium sp. YIM 134829]|uniref:GNAT family N-acetyltransferase n=1 Tax=Rhizobium sp. YIM 134829 TaxID=3390453 RepID=UPI003979C611